MNHDTDHTGKLFTILLILFFSAVVFLSPRHAGADDALTILLTSNMEGNFTLDIDTQEKSDPMVLMGQSIQYENGRGIGLYLDLGNAFYPGVLSKHNYGAAVMDFFNFFDCRTSLVSSNDMRLGIESLEFLEKNSATKLLSANILRDDRPVFQPYIIQKTRNSSVAFIGLSSKRILVDVAEKRLYKIKIGDEKEIIARTIAELQGKGVGSMVLLSGLDHAENMELLNAFKEISLIVAGGDNKGELMSGKVVRMDTDDGRSIVSVPPDKGYCLLTLSLGKTVTVAGLSFKQPSYHRTDTPQYNDFINRTTLYKKQFLEDSGVEITDLKGKTLSIDHERVANLLRDRYNGEIAIVKKESISPLKKDKSINYIDVLSAVNENYTVYTYRLTGAEIASVMPALRKNSIVAGCADDNRVQGYALHPKRKYQIVSSQTAYEEVKKALNRDIAFSNTWTTIPEIVTSDLKREGVLLKENFQYLENRFRFMTDVSFSFFYELSDISYSSNVSTPVGEPNNSYYKWGIESRIDLTAYNRYHKLILTPYINYTYVHYEKQDVFLQNNLLRGTFYYGVNLSRIVNPYHKLMVDTVVERVHGGPKPASLTTAEEYAQYEKYRKMLRPVILRETLGAVFETNYFSGKLGIGYEKKIHDPVDSMIFGFECTLKFKYDFLKYFTYSLEYDSFVSFLGEKGASKERNYLRSELMNKLSVRITDLLSLSLKHRWYYYDFFVTKESYSNSQFITSFDLITDFKM